MVRVISLILRLLYTGGLKELQAKGADRIQGYMDTPDTIWINTADTAECTGSVSIWINTGSIGRIAILSGCELYGAQAQASEHLTAL